MNLHSCSISEGVQRLYSLRISLERAMESGLVSNASLAKYALTKVCTLGAILQAISKVRTPMDNIGTSFSKEDLAMIDSIVSFACTCMLYAPSDIKLENFITRVIQKSA